MKKIFGISALVVLISAIAIAVFEIHSKCGYGEDVTEDEDDDFDDIDDEIKVEIKD